ncbi:hypothetical protein FOCC_FOCC014131 [Frankliniella occidentalis]|nr:hypothetical protein FOCC_FOCC014131 [Frankliniella occidentalis]
MLSTAAAGRSKRVSCCVARCVRFNRKIMTPTPMITPSGVKRRRPLSIQQKIHIIDLLNEGASLLSVSKQFELHPQHVRKILLNSVSYRAKFNMLPNKSSTRIKKTQWFKLEQELYNWCLEKQALREQFSDKTILAQAVEMSAAMPGLPPFRASRGWLTKFKRRYLIPSLREQRNTLRTLNEAKVPKQAEEEKIEDEVIEDEVIEEEKVEEENIEENANVSRRRTQIVYDWERCRDNEAEGFPFRVMSPVPSTPTPEKKRKTLSLEQKISIADLLDRGENVEDVAEKFDVRQGYVRKIQMNAAVLREKYRNKSPDKSRSTMKESKWAELEKKLYVWWLEEHASGKYITNARMKAQALKIHAAMGDSRPRRPFTAHKEWLRKFKLRYQVPPRNQQTEEEDPEVSVQREGESWWGGKHTPIVYDPRYRGDKPASRPASGREASSSAHRAEEAGGGTPPAGSAISRDMTLAARYDEAHDSSMCTDTACLQYCVLESSRVSLSPKHDRGALELVKQKLDELERKIFSVEFALDAKIFNDSQKEESIKQQEENNPPEVVVCEDKQELLAASFRRVRRWTKKQDRSTYLQFKPIYKLFKNKGQNE